MESRPDPRWRDHFAAIVSSAFDDVAKRRFSAKGHGDRANLPYATAGQLFGGVYTALGQAIATNAASGKPPFVLRATAEELEALSRTRLHRPLDRRLLTDHASLLKKTFGTDAAIESEKGVTNFLLDRRYRLRFHFKSADAVRFFWLDCWERRGKEELLVFSTAEFGPMRSLSQVLEAGPGQFGPAEAFSDQQIDGFVAELPVERQEALFQRLRDRLRNLGRALFAPFSFVFKFPVGVSVGGVIFAVAVGFALATTRSPSQAARPSPPTPATIPGFSGQAPPERPAPALPRDVAQLILTWPTPSPPQSSRPWNPAVKYPDRFSIGTREDSCNGTIPFVARARAPLLCGRLLGKTPYGYNVAATVAFPISDGSKRYFVRISNRSPSNTWKPSVIEAVVKGDVAAETFVLPIDATEHVSAPIFAELFSVDSKQEVRYEGSELFPLVY